MDERNEDEKHLILVTELYFPALMTGLYNRN